MNSNQTRVLDAVNFDGQANGVTSGRYPDGAPNFQGLSAMTQNAANAAPLVRPLVINEIMYHPISESNNDEYIEIYNRSANAISLANWRLQDGIQFSFPRATLLSAPRGLHRRGRRTCNNLLSKYPQLNATNTFGNYSGKLSDSGERVALAMPEDLVSTNTQGVVTPTFITFQWTRCATWTVDAGASGATAEAVLWN